MARGRVKRFSDEKGRGAIGVEGSGEVLFVHFMGIVGDGFRSLGKGDEVEFEIPPHKRGKRMALEVVAVAGRAEGTR